MFLSACIVRVLLTYLLSYCACGGLYMCSRCACDDVCLHKAASSCPSASHGLEMLEEIFGGSNAPIARQVIV
jgi:hypothetical protein